MVNVRIEGKNILWEAAYDRDSRTWVGICRALNLNAVGETYEELQECANDAMGALFIDLLVTGELEAFLRANSWKKHGDVPPSNFVRFDVPAGWREARREELALA